MLGCVYCMKWVRLCWRKKFSAQEVSGIWIINVAQVSMVICIVDYHTT